MEGSAYLFSQWKELGIFSPREQRYIRMSLDVAGYEKKVRDAAKVSGISHEIIRQSKAMVACEKEIFSTWARNADQKTHLKTQMKVYENIPRIQESIPTHWICSPDIEDLVGPLVFISTFDLSRTYLESYKAYRFLYERIFGASVRPWLPSSFCCAAAMPILDSGWRISLLKSITEADAAPIDWETAEPTFVPERIEDNKYE